MKVKKKIIATLVYLCFLGGLFGIGYGLFVDTEYFFFSKITYAEIIDKSYGDHNEPHLRIEYFDDFKEIKIQQDIILNNSNINEYSVGSTKKVTYTRLSDLVFLEGQQRPSPFSFMLQLAVFSILFFVFIRIIRKGV